MKSPSQVQWAQESVAGRPEINAYSKAHKYVVYRQRRNFVNRPAVNKLQVKETFDDEGKSTLYFSHYLPPLN